MTPPKKSFKQDVCDRKIAVLKSKIREYQMKKNDVTNENEMLSALTHNGGLSLSIKGRFSLPTF